MQWSQREGDEKVDWIIVTGGTLQDSGALGCLLNKDSLLDV